jgi:hypothetical protein
MTQTVKGSVNLLVDPTRRKREPLPAPKPAVPITAGVGFASPQAPVSESSGGIASPLTETEFAQRTYYAEETLFTSDGLFSWTRARVKTISMTDANGAAVQIRLKAPTT